LETTKFWGAQKFGEHCPPIPPVFTGLVLTRCRIFLQLRTALPQETADNLCS